MYKFFLGCLLLGLFPQCQTPREVDDSSPVSQTIINQSEEKILPINPRMFRRALYQQGKLLLVYGTHEEGYLDPLREAASALAESYGDRIKVDLVPVTSFSPDSLASHPCLYLGTPSELPLADSLRPGLPFYFSGDSLFFAQKPYVMTQHIWHLRSYPNPLNPYLPLGMIMGTSTESLVAYVNERVQLENNRFARSPWDYELVRGSERVMMGYFSHKPENAWTFDPTSQWDYIYHPNTEKMDTYFSYVLHGEVASSPLRQLPQEAKGAIEAMNREIGIPLKKWEFPRSYFRVS